MDIQENKIMGRGFLPVEDPLENLPETYRVWDEMGYKLPKLLVSDHLHAQLENMPTLSVSNLNSQAELERAMLLLSFFGHAFVWGRGIKNQIPTSIALPWYEVSRKLARPPVLSYASYALNNWKKINKNRGVELGNIALLQNFLGGIDEEWFVLIHVDIEMKAAFALRCFIPLQYAAKQRNIAEAIDYLKVIKNTLEKMCLTLSRMPERCDPYIYYNRVRPYIHGWKDNPALPGGVYYQGVPAYHSEAQQYRGETGAQSSIVPSFDALFGVIHSHDPLYVYLMEMRDYMPKSHREFIKKIEENGSIREFIVENYSSDILLKELYNECLTLIANFRKTHLHYAAQYIQKQSQSSAANPTQVGTGGTPFMQYLRKHKDETLNFLI